jgi:UV DNA damage repair endonuclease
MTPKELESWLKTDESQQVGQKEDGEALASGVRLVLHPDQFVVLSSDRPEVIENSIKILRSYAQIFDWLGLP